MRIVNPPDMAPVAISHQSGRPDHKVDATVCRHNSFISQSRITHNDTLPPVDHLIADVYYTIDLERKSD